MFSSAEKPSTSSFEQGQEADLVDPADQFLPALDAGGIVPIQAPHDPRAVLDSHDAASPQNSNKYTTRGLSSPEPSCSYVLSQ